MHTCIGTFKISANTGVFTLEKPLDYETPPNFYNVTVAVTDGGTPAMTAMAYFYITVEDVNDNPPVIIDPNPDSEKIINIPEVCILLVLPVF